jgi:hypothetical protein
MRVQKFTLYLSIIGLNNTRRGDDLSTELVTLKIWKIIDFAGTNWGLSVPKISCFYQISQKRLGSGENGGR